MFKMKRWIGNNNIKKVFSKIFQIIIKIKPAVIVRQV